MFTPVVEHFLKINSFPLIAGTYPFSTRNHKNKTPIELAANQSQWYVVSEMINIIQYFDNAGDTTRVGSAVVDAAAANLPLNELLKLLKIKKIDTNWRVSGGVNIGYGALHHAIANRNLEAAQQLIDYGFDVNRRFNVNGKTYPSPMEIAIENHYWEGIQFLATQKADLTIKYKTRTPLQFAAKHNQWETVLHLSKFIQATKNANDSAEVGYVVLCAAKKNLPLNKLLKTKNISEGRHNVRDGSIGYGALHFAIANRNLKAAQQLIDYGFKVNKQFVINGTTYPSPLGVAIKNQHEEAFMFLIKNGADLKILLKDKSLNLASIIDDIVEHALAFFSENNKTKRNKYHLTTPIKDQLKDIVLHCVVQNSAFVSAYIFTQAEENSDRRSTVVKGLGLYIATNIMKPKYTRWPNIFDKSREIVLTSSLISQTEINKHMLLSSNSVSKILATITMGNQHLEQKEDTNEPRQEMITKNREIFSADLLFESEDENEDKPLLNNLRMRRQ